MPGKLGLIWLIASGVIAAKKPQIIIRETGIFQLLVSSQGLVRNGFVYLLDRREGRILVFDLDGRPIKIFGGLGQGPGEFNHPGFFFDLGDRGIGVRDVYSISRFSGDGVFQERLKFKGGAIWRVTGGWVWGSKSIYLYPDRGRLWIGGEKFEEPTLLAAWGDPDDIPKVIHHLPHSSNVERTLIEVDGEGETLFLRVPFSSEVQIIDVRQRAVVRTLDLDVKPIPYDLDHWKKTRMQIVKKMEAEGLTPPERSMPEYYPLVSSLAFGPDGILNVSAHDPTNPRKLRHWYFTKDGRPSPPGLSSEAASRIIGVSGRQAFVILFPRETEEVQIARCPLNLVDDFIRKNPLSW